MWDEMVTVRRNGASHASSSESASNTVSTFPVNGSHMYDVSKNGISFKRNGNLLTAGRSGPSRAGFVSCGSIFSSRRHLLIVFMPLTTA